MEEGKSGKKGQEREQVRGNLQPNDEITQNTHHENVGVFREGLDGNNASIDHHCGNGNKADYAGVKNESTVTDISSHVKPSCGGFSNIVGVIPLVFEITISDNPSMKVVWPDVHRFQRGCGASSPLAFFKEIEESFESEPHHMLKLIGGIVK